MLVKIALASSWSRRHVLSMIVLSIALSVALLLAVEQVRSEVRNSFNRSVAGTDLIVGARGGELQLMLYSIFHIGQASNTISWKSFELIRDNPNVEWALPISLGDSHKGFRVVGTDAKLFDYFKVGRDEPLVFKKGKRFSDLFDTVIGADVAKKLNYRIGQSITLSHGMGATSFSEHDDRPFTIVGILESTGTPVDQSVYVSSEAIEAIHVGWQSGTRIRGQTVSESDIRDMSLTPKLITAVLVGVKSKLSTFTLQRLINDYKGEPLQAVLPGVALQQLWQLIRIAENALFVVSICVVISGFVGMLSVLLTSLSSRRKEMAILRAVGAKPRHLVGLLMMESAMVTLLGTVLGTVMAAIGLLVSAPWLESQFGFHLGGVSSIVSTLPMLVLVLALGALIGIWPGYRAYRQTAHDGLTER